MFSLLSAFPLDPGKAARPPRPDPHFRGITLCRPTPALAALALALAGCAQPSAQPKASMSDEGHALFGASPDSSRSGPGALPAENSWSIVIVAFRGKDREASAANGLAKARTVGGLRDAYTRQEGNSTVIAYGRYPSPDAPVAQADLKRIRELNLEGGRPFAGAVLAPPEGSGTGRLPELDLRHVRTTFGKEALYTLQIAAYGRDDRKPPQSDKERAEFVRYAEDAAAQLRREGEQAFYYHGPNMSLVTIGVFGAEDFDPQRPEIHSDRLRAAEEAHPENLLNGKGILVRVPGVPANSPKARRPAKSFLIVIPNDQ